MSTTTITTTILVESSKDAPSTITKAGNLKYILEWNELPSWMQVDPLIQRGYRRQLNSFNACFQSLFYKHNELVNVWSHLLPTLYYLTLLSRVDRSTLMSHPTVKTWDSAAVQIYIAGTALCLFLSAFYHCANAHSEGVACQTLKYDYAGMIVSITVTSIASTYFGLQDEVFLRTAYFGVFFVCAAVAIRCLVGPNTDGPSMAMWRTIVCAATIGSGFVPIFQKWITEGQVGVYRFPIVHLGFTMTCYFLGAMTYIARMPEKYWPRRFDIWGASHQIFHTLVAVGQLIFLFGIQKKATKQP